MNGNYRMFYQVMLCIIGILFVILGVVGEVNSIWFSIGVALVVCSSLRIFRYIRMLKNPEYKDKVFREQHDERNIKISEKAASLTFRFIIFILCIVELILFAFEMSAIAIPIGYVVCGMLIVYWISYIFYNKKI